MTFGSVFAGIGGFDLGFETAGHKCKWQIENDPYCNKVLTRHWPNVKRYGDVREIDGTKLERVDIICGGDPCQENSNARQGIQARYISLGQEFIRLVDENRPRFVVRENPTATRADAPWPWWRFRSELERLDYLVIPFRLRACCFGFDHRRDRLFLLAVKADSVPKGLQGDEFKEMAGTRGEGLCDVARRDRRNPSPRICRGIDGIPHRVDRLRGLGNAVIPAIAEFVGRMLNEDTREVGPKSAHKDTANQKRW